MPPMPPIPPMSGIGAADSSFFGRSAIIASVVSSRPETEDGVLQSERVTFVGSMIPASIRSPYSPVAAL
jgi:hypothetical protein